MIIRCDQCGKRYRIDEGGQLKKRMFFRCRRCSNKIEVNLPDQSIPTVTQDPEAPSLTKNQNLSMGLFKNNESGSVSSSLNAMLEKDRIAAAKKRRFSNMSVGKKLLLVFLIFVVSTGAILSIVYMMIVPALMHNQINLRTYSISRSFAASIHQPLLVNNYLLVNKAAEVNAKLPGVAYVAVLNKKGVIIAGIFGKEKQFSPAFIEQVKQNGFPKDILDQNKVPEDKSESALDYSLDGQEIHDVALVVGDSGGEVHVGLFTEEIKKSVRKSMIPLLIFLAVISLLGCLSFFLVAQTISNPIRSLTLAAEKISFGEIDLPIEVTGGGEIGELAASLERMRSSIKKAIVRLRRVSIQSKRVL